MFYVVKKGRNPGIYTSWGECQEQVSGFSGAEFHKFKTLEEAQQWEGYGHKVERPVSVKGTVKNDVVQNITGILQEQELDGHAWVDGSWIPQYGKYGYGVLLFHDGRRYEWSDAGNDPNLASMRNVSGELLAVLRLLQEVAHLGVHSLTVHYDYQGIGAWADGQWRTTVPWIKDYIAHVQEARKGMRLSFVKEKGHSGDRWNDYVDEMAKDAVMGLKRRQGVVPQL